MRKLKVTELCRMEIGEFREAEKMPLTVVLDNIRSMYNVGSVFRTADAFRLERIMLCGITACPPNAEIHKTALGAELSMDWERAESAVGAVRKLTEEGYRVYALEQVENSVQLQDFHIAPGGKYALVLGNEVKGVAQEVVDICDGAVEIPQFGTKHSMNVAVSAGIAIWKIASQMLGIER